MIFILKRGQVFAPEALGEKDILVAGQSIIAVSPPSSFHLEGLDYQEIEAKGKYILPGFIDPHVHILGGGGEGGPNTRAPEIRIEDIIQAGVTTVIGCLGTDSVTRHMSSLYAKARALEIEGISTFIFSGAYDLPPVSLTGSIRKDLVLIDKVIGCGEVAISDHRSSQPSFEEIAHLAAECRVGGLLGGKAGILHLHLGDGPRRLEIIWRLLKETEIPITQIIPTHVNRNKELLLEAFELALKGGTIDLTAMPEEFSGSKDISLEEALKLAMEKNVPLERITVSSDANGSLPVFDSLGHLCGLTIATEKSLLTSFQSLIKNRIVSLEQAARLFSTNAACVYQLKNKGFIKAGYDADLIMFDSDLNLEMVMAKGRLMLHQGKLLARSTFVQS